MKAILTIRTDRPEAEVGVYDLQGKQIGYYTWLAHRQLSSTLLGVIRDELAKHDMDLEGLFGVVVFRGPGSFTGLRIGIAIANALTHELKIPIVGVADENQWLERGLSRIQNGDNDQLVLPEYGREAHITLPKK